MPEREPADAFPRMGYPFRQERAEPNRDDGSLPDDNKSIRELTEVFKPLQLAEYLKA